MAKVSLDSHSPVDEESLEREVCAKLSPEVDDEVGRAARLTGVARSSLICSCSVWI